MNGRDRWVRGSLCSITEVINMTSHHDRLPDAPPGDRWLAALLILGAGAFAAMLVWLIGR
jgi:hypothetical protein